MVLLGVLTYLLFAYIQHPITDGYRIKCNLPIAYGTSNNNKTTPKNSPAPSAAELPGNDDLKSPKAPKKQKGSGRF